MNVTSTVTLTNETTTITVNIQCNSKAHFKCEIKNDGNNSSVKVTDLNNLPEPAKPVQDTPTSLSYPEADKMKHLNSIKNMLNIFEQNISKDNKAVAAISILDYVCGEGLEFTKAHERFKNTVIKKCYEFKQLNYDIPDVVKKADETLNKLGISTTIPSDCNNPIKPYEKKKDIAIITTPIDLVLFIALAKKYNFKNAIENPTQYLTYFENAVSSHSSTIKGSTKAGKMNDYFLNFTDDGRRIALMKTIFKKHNIIFSDAAMTLYNEWQNTYKPTGKTNRYIKMNVFATTHKCLFTP